MLALYPKPHAHLSLPAGAALATPTTQLVGLINPPPPAFLLASVEPHTALRIPELLSLILSAIPHAALSPALLTVHSSFHAALAPHLWRSAKLGEVPVWRKFVEAVRAGAPGAGWVAHLDLRVTQDVLDRGLVDGLALELARGRFGALRSLAVLGSSAVARAVADGPLFAPSPGGLAQLDELVLDGAFPPSAVLALVGRTSSPALRSLALQAQTLCALDVGADAGEPSSAFPEGTHVQTVVVLPSTPFPWPSTMVHPRWVDHLLAADVAALGPWLDALAASRAAQSAGAVDGSPAPARALALLTVDVGPLDTLGADDAQVYDPLRVRVETLAAVRVALVGLPVPRESAHRCCRLRVRTPTAAPVPDAQTALRPSSAPALEA